MKRSISIILIVFMVLGLCTTAVYAGPQESSSVKSWVVNNSGKNIYVKILQYPRATVVVNSDNVEGTPILQPVLHEIILEMDLEPSQKYFENFENGGVIPEIVLTGINIYNKPTFKFTLNNCTVCGYTVTEFNTGNLMNAVRAVVRFSAEKITSETAAANSGPIQMTYADKLNTCKLTIDGNEYSFTNFSGIDGYSMVTENTAGARSYGSPLYNNSEMGVQYDKRGTLPGWLGSLDQTSGGISGSEPQYRLKYEFSSPYVNKKMVLEADVTAIGQELKDDYSNIYTTYTFKVDNLDFAVTTADADIKPALTISPVIMGPSLINAVESSWAGNWVTTFGKMALKQEGTKVTGEYGDPVETLIGTVSGNKLSGTWQDSFSSGKFEFTMAADGSAFSGTMYNQMLGDRGTFEWNGDRE